MEVHLSQPVGKRISDFAELEATQLLRRENYFPHKTRKVPYALPTHSFICCKEAPDSTPKRG